MNARLESVAPQDDAPNSSDLMEIKNQISQGKMTQSYLVRHVQNLEKLGQLQAAHNLYSLWLKLSPDPNKQYILFNFAGLLQSLGKFAEAVVAYESCISLSPNFSQAYINLGLLHEKQGRTTKALLTWVALLDKRHSKQSPTDEFLTTAHNHIGRVQENLRNYDQAEAALEQSLLINPNQPGVIQHWVHIRQKACKWPVYKPLPVISMAELRRYTSPLAMLALTNDPAEQLANAQSFVARTYPFQQERLHSKKPHTHKRMRIGYVSADFRQHAVGFLLPAVFKGHDAKKYKLYAYDYSQEDGSALRSQIIGQFDQVCNISKMTDRQAAEKISADEIDILIDLHGLSAGARPGIFALHPAPRQGTYLGFIGPTGMPWFDFVISDPLALPEELSFYFTERPAYVSCSFLPLISHEDSNLKVSRQDVGLAEGAFVMAALGNTYKITPELFACWMSLLKRIPQAVLWLIDDNQATTNYLTREALAAGISAEQLLFSPRTQHQEFCSRLKLADVYLDTFPYNCGSTSNDVINAGVPLVTRYGKTMVSRMGLSLLNSVKAGHLCTQSFSEYADKVVELFLKKAAGCTPFRYEPSSPISLPEAWQQTVTESARLNDTLAHLRSSSVDFELCSADSPTELLEGKSDPARSTQGNRTHDKPEWGDYRSIRNHLMHLNLKDDVMYGFFSEAAAAKVGLNSEQIKGIVTEHGGSCDVLIFNQEAQTDSFFINPFYKLDDLYPGFLEFAQAISDAAKLNLSLRDLVMHSDNTISGSYFLAKKGFWLRWLEMGEKIPQCAEQCTGSMAGLMRKQTNLQFFSPTFRPLLHEQLANLILLNGEFSSKAFLVDNASEKLTEDGFRLDAMCANSLKLSYAHQGDLVYLESYKALCKRVFESRGLSPMV